ncbi:hypothetical protein SAMN05661093_10757 [Kibdelosporangium aridum]|uniref:Uncharacterized protein n=1 Tax=Kibdelosporangium aridum TaxID=2030 RepID=A0A1W2FZ02_KIBAR|nr:hypothetical protein SAMN05661093_10757 [Kibdelosporangium aridum]
MRPRGFKTILWRLVVNVALPAFRTSQNHKCVTGRTLSAAGDEKASNSVRPVGFQKSALWLWPAG